MRIYCPEDDRTLERIELYLTESEAAELLAHIQRLVTSSNVKSVSLADELIEHQVVFHQYNDFEQSGFDRRQKLIISQDV